MFNCLPKGKPDQLRIMAWRFGESGWQGAARGGSIGGPEVLPGVFHGFFMFFYEACRMKLQKMDGIYGLDLMVTAHTENDGSETVVEPDIGGRSDMSW